MRHAMSERTARSSASAVVLAVAFSGLVVLHATYVWPKLLSAAFVFLAAAVLLGPRDRWRAPTAGVSVGLAMMAHGSAVFALPLLAALVLVRSRRRNEMLAIAGALMMVLAPWSAYQRWIDPPGNRLLKWHLGGVEQIDERSTLRTIRDSYSHLSLADVAHLKRENVSFLYNHARVFGDAFPITGSTALVRAREFAHVANSLGVAWLAVPFALAAMIRSRWRERPATLFGAALVALALAAIGLWCVVMFGPATTFVHAGTLALPILLLAALVVWSAAIHPAIPWAVAGLGVVRGFHVWLLARPAADAGLDPRISKGAILLMVTGGVTLAATAALSALGFRTSFRAAAAPGALPRVPPASQ